MKEQLEMITVVAKLVESLRGPQAEGGGKSGGITIHKVGEDMIVETKDGGIDAVATLGLGMKDGVREIVKTMAARRRAGAPAGAPATAAAPNGASVTGASGLSGASVRKAGALPPEGTNGAPSAG